MPTIVTIEQARERLEELIGKLSAGDDVVITRDREPVARLVSHIVAPRKPRVAGSARGKLSILIEDDEHLNDFAEYMP